jgi:NitT/TauT family transport system permease protein
VTERLQRILAPSLGLLAVLVVWEVAVRALQVSPLILPSPSRILSEFPAIANNVWRNAGVTLAEALCGLLLGATVAVIVAVALSALPLLRRVTFPLLIASQVVPSVVFAPIILVWFGYGMVSKVLVAAIICFFPIVVNTSHGLTAVAPELLELAQTVGARKARVFLRIRLPNAVPYFVTSLKPATTLAMIGAVVGEFIGGEVGLGSAIILYIRFLNMPAMFATVVVLIVSGLGLFALVNGVGLASIGWYRRSMRMEAQG